MPSSSPHPKALSRDLQLALLIAACFLVLSLPVFWGREAVDLAPTWFAGLSLAEGRPDLIFPPPGDIFTVTAAAEWDAAARASGHEGLVLPYIYPPLWAALVAPLTGVTTLAAFEKAMLIAHHLAILGMLALAWRTAGVKGRLGPYLGLGLLILAGGPHGALAIFQNQPQILVSFLAVLAVERARAGASFSAGAALGVATALKVAPILLLPALLMAADARRTATGFVVVGGGLGLLSIALAGWPAHLAFLQTLSTISSTVVLSDHADTLDALISQLWLFDRMALVSLAEPSGGAAHWLVISKTLPWRAVSILLMLALSAAGAFAVRRGAGVLIWPALMIALSLSSSIAWSFHYLAPLAFLPALMTRAHPWRGAGLALLLFLPGSYLLRPVAQMSQVLPYPEQLLAVAALLLTAAVFAYRAKPATREGDRDLQRPAVRV